MRRFASLLAILVALSLAACSDDTSGSRTNNENNTNNANNTNNTNNTTNNLNNGETSCDSNGDCDLPEVCVIDAATGDGVCGDPAGTGQTGDTCSAGTDCASGVCLNGLCAAPCGDEQDCPANFTCESMQLPLEGGGTVAINLCIPEMTPCQRDDDCTDPQVCVVDRSGDPLALNCGGTVGGGGIGDACTSDADCANNLCINDVCSKPCRAPNDCATDGSFICDSVTVTTGGADATITACLPRPADICLSDADCTAPERCVANKTGSDVEFTCGSPNAAGEESGGACTDDAGCAQNLCVAGACAGPCQSTGDCSVAPDYTCEVTSIDLGNGVSDTAQVCTPPTVCDENDDCPNSEVCYMRSGANGFDQFCRAPNVGGGDLGQVCDTMLECGPNLCLETRFRDVCTVACADNTDCDVPGYTCTDTDVNGSMVKICAPSAAAACTSNNECATGTTCAIVPNVAGSALESVCVPETGGDSSGVSCTADDDCAGLVCLGGSCSSPCVDSNQCGGGQLCQGATINKSALSGTFQVCQTLPNQTCADRSECTDGVRVCGDLRLANDLYTPYCAFPNAAAPNALGDTCAVPGDCRENICLTVSNTCSEVCNDDSDCANGQACTTYPLASNGVVSRIGFCNTACSDNSDCSNGNICTINSDYINDDVDLVCEQTIGAKNLGETCDPTTPDCAEGLCLRTLLYNNVQCNSDADCAGGQTCECPLDQPGCANTAKRCATATNACTRICDGPEDCVSPFGGNQLTTCSNNTVVTRPVSGTTKTISTCSRP